MIVHVIRSGDVNIILPSGKNIWAKGYIIEDKKKGAIIATKKAARIKRVFL